MLLILALIIGMVSYSSHQIYDVAVTNVHEMGKDRIFDVASQIENYLDAAQQELWIMADAVDYMIHTGRSLEDIERYITEENQRQSGRLGSICGYIMGRYLDGTGWRPEGFEPTAQPWYKAAMEAGGDSVIVGPYAKNQTKVRVLSFSQALSDGKNVLSFDMDMQHIQEMVETLHFTGWGYGFLVERGGKILTHRDIRNDWSFFLNAHEEQALVQHIEKTDRGYFEMLLANKKSVVFINHITKKWYVVLVINKEDFLSEIRHQLTSYVFICILFFLFVTIFYYFGYAKEQKYSRHVEKMEFAEKKQILKARTLKLERKAAEQANQAKSNFLAEMSHEIRTPITAVLGMNSMILRESPNETISTYARNVENAGRNLLAIINDILDFSKIEAGKMKIINAPYQFSTLLLDVSKTCMCQAQDRGISFDVEVDATLPDVLYGDEVRVRQVIFNVLDNAVRYTSEGSIALRVQGTKDGDTLHLVILVADTGMGIHEEDLKKLFEKFVRANKSQKTAIEGAGLGLAITQHLLQLMHGSIQVESSYGKGSVFTITLPQKIASDAPIGDFRDMLAQTIRETKTTRETFRAPDAHVLVVDDTEMNLTVICGLLQQTGLHIDTATSGSAALALTKDMPYDLILMDQRMPEMDGTETLRLIQTQEGGCNRDTPSICLTADVLQGARERYLAQGFVDYMSKPVEEASLMALLMRYLPATKVIRLREESSAGTAQSQDERATRNAFSTADAPTAADEALRDLQTLTPRLLASYRALASALKPFFDAKDAKADDDLPEIGAEALQELYDGIEEFAGMYDLDSIRRLLQQAAGYSIPEPERGRFARVRECAQNSDWTGLEAALKQP